MSPFIGIPLIAFCLVVQGFFSGSEIAMVSANRSLLKQRAEEGHQGSTLALTLLAHEELLLGACLIGTNLCVVTGTTLVSAVLAQQGVHQEWKVALAFVPFALILGEALPKTVYEHHADLAAPIVAYPLRAAQVIFSPLLWVVGLWSQALRKLTGEPERKGMSRDEILDILDNPDIDPVETRMIRSVFAITEIEVEGVMTPLIDVVAVASDASVEHAIEVALRCGHSRIPVYSERIDNLVGMVHTRDLLFADRNASSIEPIMRNVPFVPESKRVHALLNDMRRSTEHIAVVVDEYGGSVGVITVEDLLEEIVGEIRDEKDADERLITQIDDRRWAISGRAEIADLETAIGQALPPGDYETVAGLLLDKLGHIPKAGEAIRIGTMVFRVDQATLRAITSVVLTT